MQATAPHANPGATTRAGTASSRERLKITIKPKRENRVAEDDDGRSRSPGGQYCVRNTTSRWQARARPRAIRRPAKLHVRARQWKYMR